MKQYFVRYKYLTHKRNYHEDVIEDEVYDSCVYKSDDAPIEFFEDLKKYLVIDKAVNPKDVKILDLKCLGDFWTREEKEEIIKEIWNDDT